MWISTKVALPTTNKQGLSERVLTCREGLPEVRRLFQYKNGKRVWRGCFGAHNSDFEEVSHWMQVPKLPMREE